MTSTDHASRRRGVRRAGLMLAQVLSLSGWLTNCAVYDSSMLNDSLGSSLGTAGNAIAGSAGDDGLSAAAAGADASGGSAGFDAGGGLTGTTGGDAGDGNASGSFGAGALGGASGSGGSSIGSGSAGGSASGGKGGSGGANGGTAGMTNAGAAGAIGSAGGAPPTVIELARGKKSASSSFQAGNEAPHGNDGDLNTKYCPADGSFPQWWRVDLGAVYALQAFSVRFEHPDRQYSYKVETSQNDSVYILRSTLSGTGAVQGDNFPPNTSARYVRITVTNAKPGVYPSGTYPTWGCFMEFSVTGS